MIVTKEQVIKALKNEPLKPNYWFHTSDIGTTPNSCPVCVVGAVLRNACGVLPTSKCSFLNKFGTCKSVMDGPIDLKEEYLHSRNTSETTPPLNALSSYFETACIVAVEAGYLIKEAMPIIREEMINYVNEEFPEDFEIKGVD